MKIISLKNFKEISFKTFKFPGGEVNVKIDTTTIPKNDLENIYYNHPIKIIQRINCSDDLMELLLITNALKNLFLSDITLELPYVPYARQDRPMVFGEALSIKVFADIINAQNYSKVIIFDPHSSVTPALINNVVVIDNKGLVYQALRELQKGDYNWFEVGVKPNYHLVSPDAGALKKVENCAEFLTHVEKIILPSNKIIIASKNRDVKTGAITDTAINIDKFPEKTNCIIIDDICDGGRTFIELAKVLKEAGANKICLIVTHGIFSKGLKPLAENIDVVITSDSFRIVPEEEYKNIINFIQIPLVGKVS